MPTQASPDEKVSINEDYQIISIYEETRETQQTQRQPRIDIKTLTIDDIIYEESNEISNDNFSKIEQQQSNKQSNQQQPQLCITPTPNNHLQKLVPRNTQQITSESNDTPKKNIDQENINIMNNLSLRNNFSFVSSQCEFDAEMIREVEIEEYVDEEDDEIVLFREDAMRKKKTKSTYNPQSQYKNKKVKGPFVQKESMLYSLLRNIQQRKSVSDKNPNMTIKTPIKVENDAKMANKDIILSQLLVTPVLSPKQSVQSVKQRSNTDYIPSSVTRKQRHESINQIRESIAVSLHKKNPLNKCQGQREKMSLSNFIENSSTLISTTDTQSPGSHIFNETETSINLTSNSGGNTSLTQMIRASIQQKRQEAEQKFKSQYQQYICRNATTKSLLATIASSNTHKNDSFRR
ncbi:UNKNOWN [Stylonychia lemnae]|uniref:Uncharacterized protein n=1 Tax=Stylonychia lemnae TaxID=5949 RepID=A0A078AET3_STYLE|nr:UNKNOWN [Stylonychia lemnae]|eukprot:CDW79388.1 UNKNOWN [Stylonychia lemnae]